MKNLQKFLYMALGAGIMALGIIIGQVITPGIEAQSNGVFDEITCRSLKVVDKTGKRIAFLGRGVSLTLQQVGQDIEGNVFEIFGEEGKPAITLSAGPMKEVLIYDNAGNSAIRLMSVGEGMSMIQAWAGEKMGLDVTISEEFRSMTLYDPLEKKDFEIEGHKVTSTKEAFQVRISNTRNALQLWGKSPYQKGIGFYGDSNEAKQTTWIP